MKRLFSEPLVQFISLAGVLYWLLAVAAPGQLERENQYLIKINEQQLIRYLQFQAKTFDQQAARKKYSSLTASEKQSLLDRYVRDEVLVREALALGLDQNDEVIRRRLMQKMEYVGQGFNMDAPAVTEQDLRKFHERNIEDYRLSASVSFTHVFFNGRKNGFTSAFKKAGKTLAKLNENKVPFSSAAEYGERFLFKRNYIDQSKELIQGHFGKNFEEQLFNLNSGSAWQGPFVSDYGVHLVLLKSSRASHLPKLSEVSSRVLADIRREKSHELQRQSFARMRDKYTISSELAQ